jgi:sugar-specific transcriptional regulator TrmB
MDITIKNMDITILKKLGLTDKEVKIYLTLLEYGAISVRGLAEITNINRGTTYDILKRLQELGLVGYYHHGTKQKFVAEKPEKLIALLKSQEERIKDLKNNLNELVPELNSLKDKGANLPVTKYYEGSRGVRIILEDVLDSQKDGDEYYVYSAKKSSEDLNAAMPEFTKKRIIKKIKVKAISLAEGGSTSGLDERRWLGTKDNSATFIIIYAGKCAFISRGRREGPVGVIIENQMIYETQKIIFLSLWKLVNKK